MPLFRTAGQKVSRITPRDEKFKEDVVHRLIENNLGRFFGDLLFIARKPRIGGREFDTLALNTATKAPVIIEYKRDKSRTVVEQVDLYYVKLKHNRSDIMILLSSQGNVEDLAEVDFEKPQVIIVAKEFTPEQREIASMKREFLRLFRYQFYEGGIMSLEEVEPLGMPSDMSPKPTFRGATEQDYTLDHFGMKRDIRVLFHELDKEITSLDSRVKPGKVNKYFIGYGATGAYFCTVSPKVKSLRIKIKSTGSPPKVKGLTVRKNLHGSMSHDFSIDSQSQLKPSLKLITKAFQDSL